MPSQTEHRAFSEEGTLVAVRRGGASSFLKVLVPVGAICFVGWMIYGVLQKPPAPSLTTPDTEEFRTTQYPAPAIATPRPQLDNGTLTISPAPEAPPAPPQPPTTIEAPPPPPPPLAPPAPQAIMPDDSEARRLAEEEARRRAEEERQKWARLRAGQVVMDNASQSGSEGLNGGQNSDTTTAAGEEEDPNRRFLARASQGGAEMSRASKNPRTDALVAQGTMIKGVLETAIQSDLAGMVRAVVAEDVWSFDGRRVLIPAGSRLVGEYRSGLTTGQTRVFIVWTRMLRSDGVSVMLGSMGTDELGRSGMTGIIDQHYFERFGSAVLLSVVGGATQFIANIGNNSNDQSPSQQSYVDPTTGQTITVQSQPNYYGQSARQIGAQQVSTSLNRIAEEALRNSINIPPTIHVDQGSRIMVFVKKDLDFSAFYPDPVKEALKEIRLERASKGRVFK